MCRIRILTSGCRGLNNSFHEFAVAEVGNDYFHICIRLRLMSLHEKKYTSTIFSVVALVNWNKKTSF